MADNRPRRWLRSPNFWFAIALVVMIAAIIIFSDGLVRGYAFKDDMVEAAAETTLALLTVALFVERGMASINAILYGDAQRQAENDFIFSGEQEDAQAVADVLGSKERLRILGSLLAALFVSAAGVRTLEGLLEIGDGPIANPLLVPVDIFLTAALIAGGSNGLAFLLQVIKNQLAPPPTTTTTTTNDTETEAVPSGTTGRARTGAARRVDGKPARMAMPAAWWARMTSTG